MMTRNTYAKPPKKVKSFRGYEFGVHVEFEEKDTPNSEMREVSNERDPQRI